MIAIYNWIANSIIWTGKNRVFADQEVNDVLDSKKGSSAEITFLLLSMFKSIGIESYPVILSTRSNGKIQDQYPIVNQFNYVIAKVVLGKNVYFLDATSRFRPYDLLPQKILNVRGLVIKEDSPEWVSLSSEKKYMDSTIAIVNVAGDGSIKGDFQDNYSGYGSVDIRDEIKSGKKLSEIAKSNFDADRNGFSIDSVSFANEDSISVPLVFNAYIHSNSYAQTAGDMIYLNPQVVNRWYDNVFKDRVRKFPVDYGYQSKVTTLINIKIPDGYEIKDNINDTTLIYGRKYMYFTRKVRVDGRQIQIKIDRERNCIIVKPEGYSVLKRFYERIIAVEGEQIVLARIKNEETSRTNSQPAEEKVHNSKSGSSKNKGGK